MACGLGQSRVSRYWTGSNRRTLDINGSCYSGDVEILTVVLLQSGMWGFRLSQRYTWRLRSSGLWQQFTGWLVLDVSRQCCGFILMWPLHYENNRRSRSVGNQWANGAATHCRRMATCSGTSRCEDWLIVTDISLTLLFFQTPVTIDQDTWCNISLDLRPQLYISWVWSFSLEILIDRIDSSLADHYLTP